MNPEPAFTIALAGNPNVGKSTIFNALTKLNQHTGNWAGKTVASASGHFSYRDARCRVVDLPGIYSLRTNSEEEEIAREYISSGDADLILVVCDATCLERGLHLLKQIADLEEQELPSIILCVNLCDEAAKKGILLDFELLTKELSIPVVPCAARNKKGLEQLKEEIYSAYRTHVDSKKKLSQNAALLDLPGCTCLSCKDCPFGCAESFLRECFGEESAQEPEKRCLRYDESRLAAASIPDFSPKELASQAVSYTNPAYRRREERLDRLLTGRFTGSLIMILLLLGVFWLTITGANYPSQFLWSCFYKTETWLAAVLTSLGSPEWIISAFVFGVFRVVAWVVSVMLPPMAIFFPLFTLLEDLGYLPRIAFNMDCAFKRCKACGKQCLTMCVVISPTICICRTDLLLVDHLPFSKHSSFKM